MPDGFSFPSRVSLATLAHEVCNFYSVPRPSFFVWRSHAIEFTLFCESLVFNNVRLPYTQVYEALANRNQPNPHPLQLTRVRIGRELMGSATPISQLQNNTLRAD